MHAPSMHALQRITVVIRHHKTTVDELSDETRICYQDSCGELASIANREANYATEYMECRYGFKYTKWARTQCHKHYINEWIGALNALENCKAIRAERDVVTAVRTVTAATNLLSSFFTNGSPKEAKSMINNFNVLSLKDVKFMGDMVQTIDNNSFTHLI